MSRFQREGGLSRLGAARNRLGHGGDDPLCWPLCVCVIVQISFTRGGFSSNVEPVLASTGPQGAPRVGGFSSQVGQYWSAQEGGGRIDSGVIWVEEVELGAGLGGTGPEGPPNDAQMGV